MESNGPIRDYMKYWRIVRHYVREKWDIKNDDLEMLFFLYSEGRFTAGVFRDYEKVFNWDNRRMSRMIREGWIIVDDRYSRARGYKLYTLTLRSKRMISDIYKHLDGSKPIPETPEANPLFKKETSYRNRKIRQEVSKINAMLKGKS